MPEAKERKEKCSKIKLKRQAGGEPSKALEAKLKKMFILFRVQWEN